LMGIVAATSSSQAEEIQVQLLQGRGIVLVRRAQLVSSPRAGELGRKTMNRLSDMKHDPVGVNISITHKDQSIRGVYRVRDRRRNILTLVRQGPLNGVAQFQLI